MDKRILFIGGSPCSGKSTVAERISEEFGAYYFKVDDYLDEFMKISAERGRPVCKKALTMTSDEISELVFEHLKKIDADFIVTEGAAYTPDVMKKYGYGEYITIVPTPDFQIQHYKEREWVPFILKDCSDKQQAFDNWMERDILFAERVKEECEKNSVPCIVNDGLTGPDEMFELVKALFDLE